MHKLSKLMHLYRPFQAYINKVEECCYQLEYSLVLFIYQAIFALSLIELSHTKVIAFIAQ